MTSRRWVVYHVTLELFPGIVSTCCLIFSVSCEVFLETLGFIGRFAKKGQPLVMCSLL